MRPTWSSPSAASPAARLSQRGGQVRLAVTTRRPPPPRAGGGAAPGTRRAIRRSGVPPRSRPGGAVVSGAPGNGNARRGEDGMMDSRRLAAAVMAAALLAACGGCGSGPSRPEAGRAASAGARPAAAATPETGPGPGTAAAPARAPAGSPAAGSPPGQLPVAPGAGAMPQTRAFPSTASAAFRNAMADLWRAVTTGNAQLGLPAFFPLAAYRQVKAIADPAADWHDRLWYDFTLDVAAAHRLVGSSARLDRVIVPASYAAWVYPGDCYNSIGYWHVPGARVVYTERGQQRSFGIASLISWRGVWYVVHLGAVLRSAAVGIVDQPAAGPGVPGPPGGC